ncbi:MAG: hypothetical protein SFV52_15760 [Saprospiraceae bacterium]|nr:hypothetical protein [Saprospiraceae bacterium]
MNQTISIFWVVLILFLAWLGYKVADFYLTARKRSPEEGEFEAKSAAEARPTPVQWILEFAVSVARSWYIVLGLFVLGFLMLKTVVGINIMDYVDATLRERAGAGFVTDLLIALLKYSFTLLALLALALVNWLTPQNQAVEPVRWRRSLRLNVYRYESALVFVLMTFFIDRVYFIDHPEPLRFTIWSLVLAVAFILVISLSINLYLERHAGKSPLRHRRVTGMVALFSAVLVVLLLAISMAHDWYIDLTRRAIQVNVLLTGLWFWVMTYPYEGEGGMMAKVMRSVSQRAANVNNLWRKVLLLVLYGVALIYILVPNVMPFPPLATLLLGIAFIVFNLDVLHFSYEGGAFLGLKEGKARLAVLAVSGLLVYLLFIHVTPSYVRTVPGETTAAARPTFDDAFIRWLNDRAADVRTDSVYPVYIVTGQGGGSRAGFWMSQAMLSLDTVAGLNFREHCFALSTVSGSSAGAAATLALWDQIARGGLVIHKDSIQRFPEAVFKGNFVTNGISGLFFTAPAHKLIPFGTRLFPDRNQRLQREESFSVAQAMAALTGSGMAWWMEIACTSGCFDQTNALDKHFLTLYRDRPTDPARQIPYFFPNTCHVQTGKRAVISPVGAFGEQGDTVFTQAIDFVRYAGNDANGPTLGAVANASELFPGFSMAASTRNGDSYVDGGYFENYGITTGLDIFRRCEQVLADTTNALSAELRSRVRLVMIAVNNAPETATDQTYTEANQWLAPVSAVFNTRFGGQAEYMRTIAGIELGDRYWEINKRGSGGVPLTRVLTTRNMLEMDSLVAREVGLCSRKMQVLFRQ